MNCKLESAMQRVLTRMVLLTFAAYSASGQILPDSPTSLWSALLYPAGSPVVPDPFSDQQTGSKEGDIVGTGSVPAFYTRFHDGGTPSLTDGQLGFRLRLAEEQNPPGFSGAAFIGIDGNSDGRLDVFVGVNNSGSIAQVGLWRAGTGLNISPSTTTLQSPAQVAYAETSLNYGWTLVNGTTDPATATFDVDNGGRTDRFLSLVVPFADLVTFFSGAGIPNVNENTTFAYVAATATQDNSLNQDLNGVSGGVNSSTTWQQLGAMTQPVSANGAVPEPSTYVLLLVGGMPLLLWLRQRRPLAGRALSRR
jgi:hypothetical protein